MSVAAQSGFLDSVIGADGVVEPDQLSLVLRVTRGELATASGLRGTPCPRPPACAPRRRRPASAR